jgi:hypothetical protein
MIVRGQEMSRRKKFTVDYFPHNVHHSRTLQIIQSRYGNDGYAFWFKVLELLGSTDGHFYDFNEPQDLEYLLTYTLVNEEGAIEILESLADLGAICPALHADGVIWSDNFVDNLLPLYGKRTSGHPARPTICPQTGLFRVGNPKDGDSRGENPQSIVEESKVKYMPPMGEFKNVSLSEEEYLRLVDKIGESVRDALIESLSEYMASKGKRYKSHYATILSWHRKEQKDKPKDNPRGFIG